MDKTTDSGGNRFQALRSDMNVMATNKATLPGWEPERDTGAHDSDRRYCDKDTTARNPSGPAGIVPCNQEAGYMAAMPFLSTRTWRLQYGGEPYMSPTLPKTIPIQPKRQWFSGRTQDLPGSGAGNLRQPHPGCACLVPTLSECPDSGDTNAQT